MNFPQQRDELNAAFRKILISYGVRDQNQLDEVGIASRSLAQAAKKCEELVQSQVSSAVKEDRIDITWDSLSLGWNGDEHERLLVLVQNGKIVNSLKTTDTYILNNYSYDKENQQHLHKDLVRQSHIDLWGRMARDSYLFTHQQSKQKGK